MPLLVLSVGSASVQYELLAQLCIWTPVASVRVPVVAASLTSMHSLMFYKHIPFSHAYWPYTRCPSYRPWPSPVLVPRYCAHVLQLCSAHCIGEGAIVTA